MPTLIEWTDETWNPVTGCTKVSPGCTNCYMFALYPRLHEMRVPGYELTPDQVQTLPERLEEPLKWKKPRRVFVNSMSDAFHEDIPDGFIDAMFAVMRDSSRRGHTFQVLTKRPNRAVSWWRTRGQQLLGDWPDNVWIGSSVENQEYATRLDALALLPAAIRFVSAEPLLGPLDLRKWLEDRSVHWVIVGGESGRGARPMAPEWVDSIRIQCRTTGVPLFVKQMGAVWAREHKAEHAKGGAWTELPPSLRVRMYPALSGA